MKKKIKAMYPDFTESEISTVFAECDGDESAYEIRLIVSELRQKKVLN